jgi:lecithin:cholesterol acyltransferase
MNRLASCLSAVRFGARLRAGSLAALALIGPRSALADETPACGTTNVTPVVSSTLPETAHDATPQLHALRTNDRIDLQKLGAFLRPAADRMSDLNILIVPGYLSQFLAIPGALGLSDYLDAQQTAAGQVAHSVTRVALETEAGIVRNAQTIAQAVAATDGPICLVSHSKGGLDVLEFLLRATDVERRKIACWISFQAPFAGSPIADFAAEHGTLRRPAEFLLQTFGGEAQSIEDLRVGVRACYLATHDAKIAEIAREIPIIAVAGALDDDAPTTAHLTPFWPTLMMMRERGIRNDGMVPTTSAILPHSSYVVLAPIDHTGAVADGVAALPSDERVRLTQALIALALKGWGAPDER